MPQTIQRKMLFTFLAVTLLFLINGIALAYFVHYDNGELHASPFYSTYAAFRKLLLQPGTILMFVATLSIWLFLIYLRTRTKPLIDRDRLVLLTILLAVVYGFVLLAAFKL